MDTHEKQVIECSGIFPYVGQDPNTDCVQDLGILNERGYVLVDDDRQQKFQEFMQQAMSLTKI